MSRNISINEYLCNLSGSTDSLLDLLSSFCDEFSFVCAAVPFIDSGVLNPDALLDQEKELKGALIDSRLHSEGKAQFRFQFSDGSIKWLKDREEFLNLYKPVYQISEPQTAAISISRI